ncbi:hypothetical protein GEV33_008138 [Tenebrio molitor]|uniref:Uncharacterized protein n=1 Tax=Tenebrio molitor TaxID=7067 RepID=A0A8J6HJC0_TENMO|nr:hypothetical protein GEV33_008138 [Tenebrio molitor]
MSRDRMQSAIRSAIRVSVRSDALDVSKQFRDVQDNISLDVDNRFPDTHIHKDEHHGNDPRELSDQPSIVCETKHPGEREMKEMMKNLGKHMRKKKLEVNVEKTKMMVFNKRKRKSEEDESNWEGKDGRNKTRETPDYIVRKECKRNRDTNRMLERKEKNTEKKEKYYQRNRYASDEVERLREKEDGGIEKEMFLRDAPVRRRRLKIVHPSVSRTGVCGATPGAVEAESAISGDSPFSIISTAATAIEGLRRRSSAANIRHSRYFRRTVKTNKGWSLQEERRGRTPERERFIRESLQGAVRFSPGRKKGDCESRYKHLVYIARSAIGGQQVSYRHHHSME